MLDFKMKHEGEPPARLLAQVQMKLRGRKLPVALAERLAPILATAEDLDEGFLNEINGVVQLGKRRGFDDDEILAAVEQAIADLADRDDLGKEEDDPDVTMHGDTEYKRLGLIAAARKHLPDPRLKTPTYPRRRGTADNPVFSRQSLITALSDGLQARLDRKHTATYGQRFASMSLGEIAMATVRAQGHRPLNMRQAISMAAHSTSDFPLVLEDALSKTIARRFEQASPALMQAAHEIAAIDYRPSNLVGLSASAIPQEVGETGEIKHVTIDETGERKPSPRDFGAMFSLSNKAIYNDDLGLFDNIGQRMVAGAIERFRLTLLEPLQANSGAGHTMSDGKTVFHADHGNLAAAGSALSLTSLSDARLALRSQKGKHGEHYAIEPWALVVPPKLETLAQQVLAEINATKISDVNPFSGQLELIVEVGLGNSSAWYLIGNPAHTDGLAYSYLDGQNAPRVESKTGWDTLGTDFRLTWALDARFVNFASWYKNPGV